MVEAYNGKSAVDQALKNQHDSIFIDRDMPEMNKVEVIEIIRANDEIKDIPATAATVEMTYTDSLYAATGTGTNDYIFKP